MKLLLSGLSFPDEFPLGSIVDTVDALDALDQRRVVADEAGIGFVPVERLEESQSSDDSGDEEADKKERRAAPAWRPFSAASRTRACASS